MTEPTAVSEPTAVTEPDGETEVTESTDVTSADATRSAAAGSVRPHWAVFIGLGVGVVVVDQLVKAWVAANFVVGVPVQVIGDFIRITITHNGGALFGLFQGSAFLFAAVSLAVLGIIVWYEARAGASLIVSVALGLLIGGAVGNLLDRIRLGYVIDFVDAGLGTTRWYTFNVADAAVSGAIVLLVVLAVIPARGDGGS